MAYYDVVIVNKNIFQLSFPSFSSRKTPKFVFWPLKIQKSPPPPLKFSIEEYKLYYVFTTLANLYLLYV